MAKREWVLTDVDNDVHIDSLQVGSADVGGRARGYSVSKRTLAGGLRHGVDLVEVDNGTCRFSVIPTRGMGIWRAQLGDLRIGWDSPVRGPVHPNYVPTSDPSGLGWLDGFDELVVRCGLESNGAPDFDPAGRLRYPLHGKIANRPAHEVRLSIDGDAGEICVTGVVDEVRFHFQKLRLTATVCTRVGEKGFRLRDTVTNLSGDPAEMQLLYHVNIGPPLLGPGAHLVAPVKTVVPMTEKAARSAATWNCYPDPQAAFEEEVFLLELLADRNAASRILLENAAGEQGVSLAYDASCLPCFTQWRNAPMRADGYVTGLEPATNFPNPRTFEGEQGRVVRLEPGASVSFAVALQVETDQDAVAGARQAIAEIQAGVEPRVHDRPQAGWSPAATPSDSAT